MHARLGLFTLDREYEGVVRASGGEKIAPFPPCQRRPVLLSAPEPMNDDRGQSRLLPEGVERIRSWKGTGLLHPLREAGG